jgi:hypothetical protein
MTTTTPRYDAYSCVTALDMRTRFSIMTNKWGRCLRGAALGFAVASGYNSVVAIREGLPGEPFGIRIPLSVSSGVLVGWGAGVAAPWPMPLAAVWAANRNVSGERKFPAVVCAGLGFAAIAGILMEHNTYRAPSWTMATRRAVFLHVGTSVVLAGAGIGSLRFAAKDVPGHGDFSLP